MNVVIFSGGRGSTVLSKRLVRQPGLSLTVLINGYDDGASTGEVRRFLGDCLGPSDFRKNASRFASELNTCECALIDLFDLRLPMGLSDQDGISTVKLLVAQHIDKLPPAVNAVRSVAQRLSAETLARVADRLGHFLSIVKSGGFAFADCAIGNLVFAGCYLSEGRNFNRAVNNYCGLMGLPDGLIVNVTNGENLFLVALDRSNHFLASEEAIVDSARKNHIEDIYLIAHPIGESEKTLLEKMDKVAVMEWLQQRSIAPVANPAALEVLERADLIIYSPGTQHSSLYPSYMTPKIGLAITANFKAIKLLITNIYEDAEITNYQAVDIADRARFYLREKDRRDYPDPLLVTHSLINYPDQARSSTAHIAPGDLGLIDDPRAIRIGEYEDASSGFHDADKALTPFINTIFRQRQSLKLAVLMQEAISADKITQSVLQMLRHGTAEQLQKIDLLSELESPLPSSLQERLPFQTIHVLPEDIQQFLSESDYDYVVLFESSGMYHGGDIMKLISVLESSDLDAVWGSRRLSVNDIHDSYRLRFQHRHIIGAISYLGSHLLSLVYLFLFGRYISDSLSGVRVIRKNLLVEIPFNQEPTIYNQQLLSGILRKRGEVLEMPVRFFSQSPKKVKRTTIIDGLKALGVILKNRLFGQHG
ncbi:MAG: hypothetical protein GXP23_09450 [Gammaproteobacteria bacterium]|nr:hypothetical protein [Gammaproteobacteria bacterium]